MRVVGPWVALALLGWTLCSGFSAWEPQTEVATLVGRQILFIGRHFVRALVRRPSHSNTDTYLWNRASFPTKCPDGWGLWEVQFSSNESRGRLQEKPLWVPPPKNIVVKSYNYNISVCWDYENSSSKPLFTVRITCYSTGIYEEVDTCINITQHYCDLTNKTDQCETFWVGVKALSGQHESKYNEQKFDVLRDGQIGPPKFNLFIDNHDVILNIESPLSLYGDLIDQFTYKVFVWPNGSPEERQEFIWEDCFDQTCSLSLPISSLNTSYCISVQAILSVISKAGEESEEQCIFPSPKNHLGLTLLISFGTVVLLLLATILTIVFIKLREKKITLPKSLVTVVRNQVSSAEFKSECKYDIISSTSYKPVIECEDEKSVEKLDVTEKVKATDPSDYSKKADADDSQGIQGEGSTQEDTGAEIHENEQIHEDSIMDYSKSLTGQDTCSSLQNQDLPKADVQRSTVLGCSVKASGYDKPHWIGSSSRDEF